MKNGSVRNVPKLSSTETDLSKAQRMAVSQESFKALCEGDLEVAISFLMYIRQNEDVKHLIIEKMYEHHLKIVSAKMNGDDKS